MTKLIDILKPEHKVGTVAFYKTLASVFNKWVKEGAFKKHENGGTVFLTYSQIFVIFHLTDFMQLEILGSRSPIDTTWFEAVQKAVVEIFGEN